MIESIAGGRGFVKQRNVNMSLSVHIIEWDAIQLCPKLGLILFSQAFSPHNLPLDTHL
jgi:hypothetical protein